jgi:hypothetical protein
MVARCGADGQPKLDLLSAHTRLWYRLWVRRWSEQVELPFVTSQTKYNGSLAPVEADDYSATNDMVARCGADGQPKLDLLSTHTRLWFR